MRNRSNIVSTWLHMSKNDSWKSYLLYFYHCRRFGFNKFTLSQSSLMFSFFSALIQSHFNKLTDRVSAQNFFLILKDYCATEQRDCCATEHGDCCATEQRDFLKDYCATEQIAFGTVTPWFLFLQYHNIFLKIICFQKIAKTIKFSSKESAWIVLHLASRAPPTPSVQVVQCVPMKFAHARRILY